MSTIRIGTSGWHYDHWVGPFYPPGTRPKDFLAHYLRHFDCVEINNSFYRLPSGQACASWRGATPDGFLFACKASRFITHIKKLTGSADLFLDRMAILGPKLGPILFQLPPGWKVNIERLAGFLAALPRSAAYAFEFRNDSWINGEVLALLLQYDVSFCIHQIAGRLTPDLVTARLIYVRLHGPGEQAYGGSYDDSELAEWAIRLAAWRDAGHRVHVYFDNDQAGYAVRDALRLKEMVG